MSDFSSTTRLRAASLSFLNCQSQVESSGIVKHGVRYSGMAAWDGEIPEEKIWQVVTFLSRLRNLPPDVEADWHQPPVEKSP